MNGAYKFSDALNTQEKEVCDWIEDGSVVLTIVKAAQIYKYGLPTLQDCEWKEIKVILKEETLGEICGQCIFSRF